MLTNKLIDGIIKEPLGGAHANRAEMFGIMKTELLKHLSELKALDVNERVNQRIEKFCTMGVVVNS